MVDEANRRGNPLLNGAVRVWRALVTPESNDLDSHCRASCRGSSSPRCPLIVGVHKTILSPVAAADRTRARRWRGVSATRFAVAEFAIDGPVRRRSLLRRERCPLTPPPAPSAPPRPRGPASVATPRNECKRPLTGRFVASVTQASRPSPLCPRAGPPRAVCRAHSARLGRLLGSRARGRLRRGRGRTRCGAG